MQDFPIICFDQIQDTRICVKNNYGEIHECLLYNNTSDQIFARLPTGAFVQIIKTSANSWLALNSLWIIFRTPNDALGQL